jgi:mRNA-degrading endonuclease toxin of MazEF toxin-antitoxin module
MKRGEVWWVNFEPALGSEIRKKRPAVIVSNDVANTMMSRVQVVPVTSILIGFIQVRRMLRLQIKRQSNGGSTYYS